MPTTKAAEDTQETLFERTLPGLEDIEIGGEPGATVMEVGPELAEKWLDRNLAYEENRRSKSNRPVRSGRVSRYASMMSEDRWILTPDAIAFDVKGRLTNGQHRLKAIRESGQAQTLMVGWNVPRDSFKYTDSGIKRTAGDVLAIEGFPDPIHLGAAARLILLHRRGELRRCDTYENAQNYEILSTTETCMPRLYESSVKFISNLRGAEGDYEGKARRSFLTFIHFAFAGTYGERMVNQYIRKVVFGEDTPGWDGDPTANPAQKMHNKYGSGDGLMAKEQEMAFLIKTSNAFFLGEDMKRLIYRGDEDFPELKIDEIPEFRS